MGPPQQAPRWRLAALVALASTGRCDAGMFSSFCKMCGVQIPVMCSSDDTSSSCTQASCCKDSSCYAGGFMPMTKCNSDRGETSCSSMMGKGYCVCSGGNSCATNKCASSRLLGDNRSVGLWEEDGRVDIPPEDHTAGLMTYGLIVAATAGLGVRWALGGRRHGARARVSGLLDTDAGGELELQGHEAAEE